MSKAILVLILLITGFLAEAQKAKSKNSSTESKVSMTADQWEFKPGLVEFITHKNVPAIRLKTGGDKLILKNRVFTNGTIEYDVEPHETEGFAGIFFHMESDKENEYFYLRPQNSAKHNMNAVQYASFVKGINLWDLLPHYQGPANMKKGEWNHIKLVVSGMQMRVYINDMTIPALEIPRLEGNTKTGHLAFNGRSTIANLVIKLDEVEGLPAIEGFDPTHHDSRYIRKWQMTEPQLLPRGRELYDGDFPKGNAKWQPLNAERRGLVNITRVYGGNTNRTYVWLRARLISETDQKKRIALGFSDEVWVFVNRQPVFVDKNLFQTPGMQREPRGRISVENGQFEIPLRKGDNELLIGIANDFFGWGIIARLNNMDGMDMDIDFPAPIAPPKNLQYYTGTYKTENAPVKLHFTIDGNDLVGRANDQQPVSFDYLGGHKFRNDALGIIVEFNLEDKSLILKEGNSETLFIRE